MGAVCRSLKGGCWVGFNCRARCWTCIRPTRTEACCSLLCWRGRPSCTACRASQYRLVALAAAAVQQRTGAEEQTKNGRAAEGRLHRDAGQDSSLGVGDVA